MTDETDIPPPAVGDEPPEAPQVFGLGWPAEWWALRQGRSLGCARQRSAPEGPRKKHRSWRRPSRR